MEARRFVDEYSGFFNGSTPSHADVAEYFTSESFAEMFGRDDADLPAELDWDDVRDAAHAMITERTGRDERGRFAHKSQD